MPLELGTEDPLPPRGLPLPAHGGRSLKVRACGVELAPLCAGRGAFWAGALLGRSEPEPCGARPRSVVLPCASQVRELLPARCAELFPAEPFVDLLAFDVAEGGRFCESSCWRAVIPEFAPEFAGALPGRFSNWPLVLMLLCGPELPT